MKTDTGDIEVDNVLNTRIISEADTGDEDVNGSDDSSGVTLTVTTDTEILKLTIIKKQPFFDMKRGIFLPFCNNLFSEIWLKINKKRS